MAPPNSSSFSVRVVLPASGWEMMAKVRRRLISWSNMRDPGFEGSRVFYPIRPPGLAQILRQDERVLPAVLAGVVVLAHTHFIEALGPVEGDGRSVGETHFQEHLARPPLPRQLHEVLQQVL